MGKKRKQMTVDEYKEEKDHILCIYVQPGCSNYITNVNLTVTCRNGVLNIVFVLSRGSPLPS